MESYVDFVQLLYCCLYSENYSKSCIPFEDLICAKFQDHI